MKTSQSLCDRATSFRRSCAMSCRGHRDSAVGQCGQWPGKTPQLHCRTVTRCIRVLAISSTASMATLMFAWPTTSTVGPSSASALNESDQAQPWAGVATNTVPSRHLPPMGCSERGAGDFPGCGARLCGFARRQLYWTLCCNLHGDDYNCRQRRKRPIRLDQIGTRRRQRNQRGDEPQRATGSRAGP